MLENNNITVKLGGRDIPVIVDIQYLVSGVKDITPVIEEELKYPVVGRASISYTCQPLGIQTSRVHNVYKDNASNRFFVDIFDDVKYIEDIDEVPILDTTNSYNTYTVNNQIKYIYE